MPDRVQSPLCSAYLTDLTLDKGKPRRLGRSFFIGFPRTRGTRHLGVLRPFPQRGHRARWDRPLGGSRAAAWISPPRSRGDRRYAKSPAVRSSRVIWFGKFDS